MILLNMYSLGLQYSDAFFIILCAQVVFLIGFIKVDNKSIACDRDAGPGEDLGQFILKFCNRKGLIVENLQLKQVIETKLVSFSFMFICVEYLLVTLIYFDVVIWLHLFTNMFSLIYSIVLFCRVLNVGFMNILFQS